MTDVSRQSTADLAAPSTRGNLSRAFWLLARLYARRAANRFTRLTAGRSHASQLGGKRHWARPLVVLAVPNALILWALSSTFDDVLREVALHHGPAAGGAGVLLTCSALYGLLLFALLVDSDPQRGTAAEEGAWLTTLPVPAWLLYARRACEQGLVQPFAWLGAYPLVAGLAAFAGWGWLTPFVAVVLIVPLLLCAGILAGLGSALRARFCHLLWFRTLSWLLPAAAFLVVWGLWVLVILPRVGVSLAKCSAEGSEAHGSLLVQKLAFAADLRWLPLAEPARVLLARNSPGALLGWGLAYLLEAGGFLAAGAWALSRIYRAESMGAPLGRRGTRALTNQHSSRSPWLRRLGPVVLREALLLKKYPGRVARVLLVGAAANAVALLAPRLGPDHFTSRPGNVLLNIGTIVVFALSHRLLDKERGALTLLASLPRPISSTFAHQTLLIGLTATALAAPAAVYRCRDLSTFTAALEIIRGLVGIAVVAVLNSALWMRGARDPQPSQWRKLLESFVVLAAAAPIALVGPRQTPSAAGTALLVLLLVWDSAAVRLASGGDPSPRPPKGLTLKQGVGLSLTALLVLPVPAALVVAAGGSIGTRLLVAQGTLAVLVGSVLLTELDAEGSIWQAIGAARGKGVLVSIREGVLWAGVASANGWLWLWASGFKITKGPAQSSAVEVVVALADSPALLVGLLCLVAPVVEEAIFRGFLYRALRRHWGVMPCAAASALAFAALHDAAGMLSLLGLGLCSALALERSRSLLAPILTHAAYNAFIIAVHLWV